MVNETKVTSRKALTLNLFALECNKKKKINKKLKNDERNLFGDCPRILDLSVNT